MKKKKETDVYYKLLMVLFTGLIALGTLRLAFFSVPELSKNIENITIERGKCIHPHVIYGIVTSFYNPPKIATLTITNKNTGDRKIMLTNEGGEYVENIANFPNCWVGGDNIEISACIENTCNKKEFIFKLEGGGTRTDIKI